MYMTFGNAVISLITGANAEDAKKHHQALRQFNSWDDVAQHYKSCSYDDELVFLKLRNQVYLDTLDVLVNEEGDVLLNDERELEGSLWFMEGQYSTNEILAIEPTSEQFALLKDMPDSANGDLGLYLSYWDNYM